ncbi:hypothetical protein PG985_007466 [Apiospora marii]|uniref:Myb-like domain-containing protein n=1 Tax=Apiospora marii TaxID=335849 RepID=A0ABR1SNG7_9PEZI
MMSAYGDAPRQHHDQVQSIRGRFRKLITHYQSRRAGLLWDSAPSPPDLLHPRGLDDQDRYDLSNSDNDPYSSYYYPVAVMAPHGGGSPNPSSAATGTAAPRAPPSSPPPPSSAFKPPVYEPEGFASFFWTAEEDRQLLELRERCKLDWEEIAERLLGRRSASACCSRYNRTLFNKHLEKMASKSSRNERGRQRQLPVVVEEEEGTEGNRRGVSTAVLETSPYSAYRPTPLVSPSSSSLPDWHGGSHGYYGLSNLALDDGADRGLYRLRSAPEPLEPRVADTCSDVLTKARFCLSVGL